MSSQDLHEVLKHLPDNATVPVGWVREHLEIEGNGATVATAEPEPPGDLTVAEVAKIVRRSESSVRSWCPNIPGAYKLHGRDWRIPREGLRAYLDAQAGATASSGPSVESSKRTEDSDDDWDLEE